MLMDYFWLLKYSGKDDDRQDAQNFKLLINGIKAKKYEMKIWKLSVMNNKAVGEMAKEFYKVFSYLNNGVATTGTNHINLYAFDTDL